MRERAALLVVSVGVALFAVACGRATQEEINQALGITPTATLSPGDIATSTAQAAAVASARAALGSPGATPGGLAIVGDVVQGRQAFQFRCARCHRATDSPQGPTLAGPNSPVVAMTDQQIVELIRTGKGHSVPPGPITVTDLPDSQLANIIAYLRSIAK
ncbi:MAG: hypothetical protein KatS3mg059_0419 [Thermomicrobiales bacterium]|nr:MAG: hypothetical protein KatS3mg059_0419 [Thermomicrobiales bacterium]